MEGEDRERYKVGDNTFAPASMPKLQVAKDQDAGEFCATYIIANEDHTLGNSLRWILQKDPRVDFCGYSAPHPSEKKIHLRVQTKGTPVDQVLKAGLENLKAMAEHMLSVVESTSTEYRKSHDMTIPSYHVQEEEEEEDEDEDDEDADEDQEKEDGADEE